MEMKSLWHSYALAIAIAAISCALNISGEWHLGDRRLTSAAYAQATNSARADVRFYGGDRSPTKSGGSYIVFQLTQNLARGLVYVQDSDNGSCFQGRYNATQNEIEQPLYAYADLESGKWVFEPSNEPLALQDFPYQLNYRQISPGADRWFQDCLEKLSKRTP
jgi:hypothetical protein